MKGLYLVLYYRINLDLTLFCCFDVLFMIDTVTYRVLERDALSLVRGVSRSSRFRILVERC